MKWGGEMRAYYGEAARFEPINLVFNSTLTANSSDTPDVVNTGNQWASFMLGALDNQTSARLVPLQTPNLRGYAAYFQDDWRLSRSPDAEPRPALGVRAGSDRRGQPAVAAARPDPADSRDAGDAAADAGAGRSS